MKFTSSKMEGFVKLFQLLSKKEAALTLFRMGLFEAAQGCGEGSPT